MASLLKSRAVIRFQGPDTWKFLHGLLTNDVRRFGEPIGENNISTMYAAMLTPQGRFLYDMFCYRPFGYGSGSDPNHDFELFMDVDCNVVDEMLQRLKKYRLRSKVDIENVAAEFSCWQRYGNSSLFQKSSSAQEPEASPVVGMSASHGNIPKWNWFNDPRLSCLGFRGIFPSNIIPPLVEIDKETDEENYLLWRLEKGVAEGSTEIPKGEAIPLEYNLVGLKAISFDKGCYVGQEFIARTHHRGIIRKRLVPLKFIDDNGKEVEHKVARGSEVIMAATGKKVGSVTTSRGCCGLGVLRLDKAFKGSDILTIGGHQDIKVHTNKPEWWPSSWLQDFQ